MFVSKPPPHTRRRGLQPEAAPEKSNSLVLKHPIQIGEMGALITSLTFKKPKAKYFRQMPLEPKMGDMLDLAARLTGLTSVEIDELSPEDMQT